MFVFHLDQHPSSIKGTVYAPYLKKEKNKISVIIFITHAAELEECWLEALLVKIKILSSSTSKVMELLKMCPN